MGTKIKEMEIIIGKKYKHKDYHSYVKVETFIGGRFRGIGFYKNDNDCIGVSDTVIFEPLNYQIVSDEEFLEELTKIETELSNRIHVKQ